MRRLPLITLLASMSLAACASMASMSDTQKLALYSSHAGAPVRDIRYTTPLGWDKIDDDHLLLTMRPTEVWLLRISGPCLDWGSGSPTILISPVTGNRLSAKFDRISTPQSPVSCRIEEIRPVDIAAVRDSQRQMAAQ